MSDKSLEDKFLAYLYAQNTINQYSRHAGPLAEIAAEHYAAEITAERERVDAGVMSGPDLTPEEREALMPVLWTETARARMFTEVERIVAARVRDAEAAGFQRAIARQGLGTIISDALAAHWPNSGVNGWYLADLIRSALAAADPAHNKEEEKES